MCERAGRGKFLAADTRFIDDGAPAGAPDRQKEDAGVQPAVAQGGSVVRDPARDQPDLAHHLRARRAVAFPDLLSRRVPGQAALGECDQRDHHSHPLLRLDHRPRAESLAGGQDGRHQGKEGDPVRLRRRRPDGRGAREPWSRVLDGHRRPSGEHGAGGHLLLLPARTLGRGGTLAAGRGRRARCRRQQPR